MVIQPHETGVRVMIARFVLLISLFLTLFAACAKHIELTGEAPRKISRSGDSIALSPRPPELVVQLSHAGYVSAMALSASGRFLITASWDRTVRIWDAAGGLEIRRFEGHADVVNAVSLSQDEGIVLTGSKDGTARVWKTSDGEQIFAVTGHSGEVTAVAFSPDETSILTGGSDLAICLSRRKDGKQIWKSAGFASKVSSVAFTPDGRYALVGSHLVVHLWDIKKNKQVRLLKGHTGGVNSVAVSPCGRFVLTGSEDNTARLWAIDTGKEIQRFTGHTDSISTVAFSSDGRQALSASKDGTARLWDVSSAKEVRQFSPHPDSVSSAAISPDGQHVFTASQRTAYAWDVDGGKLIRSFKGNSDLVSTVAFSPDGRYALIGSWDDTARLWDLTSGLQIRHLRGHTDDVREVAFSQDGRFVLTGSRDGTARLWETASGTQLHSFTGHSAGVRSVSFSPDSQLVLTGSDDGMVRLWEANGPYEEVSRFGPHSDLLVRSAIFSPDGRSVLTGSEVTLRLWDTGNRKDVRQFRGHRETVNSVAFSPDGRFVLSTSWDRTARLWDVKTGSEVRRLVGHLDGVFAGIFSPDGHFILTGSQDCTARLWNASSGEEVQRFHGHTSRVVGLAFSPDGRFILTTSEDQTARLWDVTTGKELCRIVLFNDGTWAVVDREGRFDASNGGDVDGLHWVVGTETIALSQLKERYYDPGLLAKRLGFNKEPLRDVSAFTGVALHPAIELRKPTPEDPTLGIKLTNRGGGISKVTVLINGKEIEADARGKKVAPDVKSAELSVDIKNHPCLIPGRKNRIEVKACNAEGYLSSRGVFVDYDAPGIAPSEIPTLWAIVAGVSDYGGEAIDLHYAAKDAKDIARALRLGGSRLFGTDKVRLLTLTTLTPDTPLTKENVVKAFKELQAAKPWDILVVYLAGHGVARGDEYYYLTQEARSADLSDPAVRERVAVSSSEMVEWIKQSPSTLQVMVLDTCAAGTFEKKLSEKRDIYISSDQIRALDRMKDRTGFHVLMGSAADRVSYEATQYEQGLLTYALLKGMKGAALREQEFIDVSTLFSYAVDEVPRLAQNIMAIQGPRIAAPKGTSFDIGQLKPEDQQQITLAQAKPFLLPPAELQNADERFDNLDLTQRVRKHLREVSHASLRGAASGLPAVYVDADQLAGAIRPSGNYRVQGEGVTASLVLVRDGKKIADLQIPGSVKDLDELSQKIVTAILQAMGKIR